jgi:hypothetical protein
MPSKMRQEQLFELLRGIAMRRGLYLSLIAPFLLFFFSSDARSLNRIEGHVYDTGRHPVVDARVELRSDTESDYGNTKTDATGRFVFVGMPDGRYSIRVLPLATNLAEQTQDTQVTNVSKYKNDVEYVEFYLTAETRGGAAAAGPSAAPEVLFAQDVPAAARKLYADGIDDIKSGRATGMGKL